VSDKPIGEAVALVVDCACGEAGLCKVDGGELDEPAGFAGESVHEGEGSDYSGGREWGPPLSEELETPRIGDELGTVTH